jgi:anti-anti-sigma regulatory factor
MLLTDDAGVLTLAGKLDISIADELRTALRAHLAQYPAPALDLSQVEKCDAAVLQLLWSAQRTSPVRIAGCCPAVKEAAVALGLSLQELGGKSGGL